MNNLLYLTAGVLLCLLGGCRSPQDQEARRMEMLRVTLAMQIGAEVDASQQALRHLYDLISKQGSRLADGPADSTLLDRARQLMRQTREVLLLIGQHQGYDVADDGSANTAPRHDESRGGQAATPFPSRQHAVDTIRQQLHELDRQALRLPGRVTPYTRTKRIPQYLALLAEPGAADTSTALFTGLQVEIARHTAKLLTTITRQLESRSPQQVRLISTIRQSPDSVREGELCRVEVFPIEMFVFTPEWQPKMYANGSRIPVKDGVGKVKFRVEGPPGPRNWEGRFTFRRPGAGTTSVYKQFGYGALPH